MVEDLLKITALSKTYDGFSLENVNLRVPAGCIVGMVGTNGVGKTTVIKCILGLVQPAYGQIEIFGQDVTNNQKALTGVKGKIGCVFDTCPFPGNLRLEQIPSLGKKAYECWNDGIYRNVAGNLVASQHKRIGELSRGMGMRLQLAFALAHEPDILLLDEATAGLDPLARDEMLDDVREYVASGERGVLMASHITSDLEKTADYIVCLDGGRVAFEKPVADICDVAGLARCKNSELEEIIASGFIDDHATHASAQARCSEGFSGNSLSNRSSDRFSMIRGSYSNELLVPDRRAFEKAFPRIPAERITLDDYMRLYLLGETLGETLCGK